MRFTTAMAALASAASAATQMQINYYSDQCSTYIGEVKVSWATPLWGGSNNCYNYQYGSAIKMANCYQGSSCQCNFFYNRDCTGASTKLFYNGQCVGGAQQLKSFACYY